MQRKRNRLKYYDYSNRGTYFITISAKDKQNIFSTIVGRGILDTPSVHLSEYGKCVKNTIIFLNENNKNFNIEKYVIMPNHLHLLITINENVDDGVSGMPRPTNATIPKIVSSLKRYTNKKSNRNLWQSSYYDHIIRDEDDYIKIYKYIEENPIKWKNIKDCK